MSSSNPATTERVALITGTRWCQSCSGWSNAAKGSMRSMRGRYGPVRRWVCGGCTARSEAARMLAKANAPRIDENRPSVSPQAAEVPQVQPTPADAL